MDSELVWKIWRRDDMYPAEKLAGEFDCMLMHLCIYGVTLYCSRRKDHKMGERGGLIGRVS